jgi:hypothetical protein
MTSGKTVKSSVVAKENDSVIIYSKKIAIDKILLVTVSF